MKTYKKLLLFLTSGAFILTGCSNPTLKTNTLDAITGADQKAVVITEKTETEPEVEIATPEEVEKHQEEPTKEDNEIDAILKIITDKNYKGITINDFNHLEYSESKDGDNTIYTFNIKDGSLRFIADKGDKKDEFTFVEYKPKDKEGYKLNIKTKEETKLEKSNGGIN